MEADSSSGSSNVSINSSSEHSLTCYIIVDIVLVVYRHEYLEIKTLT